MNIEIREVSEDTELYLDGDFQASWWTSALVKSPESIYQQMMQICFEHGKKAAKIEMKKALGL